MMLRDHVLGVRLSKDELEHVTSAAARAQRKVSDWARIMLLELADVTRPPADRTPRPRRKDRVGRRRASR